MRAAAAFAVVVGIAIVGGLLAGALLLRASLRPAAAPAAGPAPRLVEEAAAASLTHAYEGGFEFYVGGGVAAFDCDEDLRPDLFLAGGNAPAALFANRSEPGSPLRFERVPSAAGDLVAVTGAYPLDIDSDGITDLAVLRRGENALLRGTGGCRFERANELWSFDGGGEWSTAFSAKWERGASWPTVAVGNYLNEASENTSRLCFDNQLFTPGPSGAGFAAPVGLSPGWCALSMLFSDWDRSGRRDLRVSNDRHYYRDDGEGQEQLWRIESSSAPRLLGTDDGWQRLRIWGMGIASHDVTGDGYPDYYLTSQGDNKLQTLAEGPDKPRFSDIALRRRALAHRPYAGDTSMLSTAWHDEFDDLNNDGFMDLLVTKGNVEAQPDHAARDPSNLLLGQPDGSFAEGAIDAGLLDYGRARGGAVVDLNSDGLLDVVIVDRTENVRLYRNLGAGTVDTPAKLGNWIEVRIEQDGTNRDAIGAWIEVRAGDRTMLTEVTVGGGHVSGQLGSHHFGLGSASTAEARVTWPDGEVGAWQPVAVNRLVLVRRDAGMPEVLR